MAHYIGQLYVGEGYVGDSSAGATGASWAAALNTGITLAPGVTKRIRIRAENTGWDAGTSFKWQARKNSGTWQDITTTSSLAKAVSTSYYADGDDVPELLTGSGTYTSNNDAADETGTITLPAAFAGGYAIEFELAFQLVSGDVANGDTVDLRLVYGDGTPLDAYTNTPTITAFVLEVTTSAQAAIQRQALTAIVSLQSAIQALLTQGVSLQSALAKVLTQDTALQAALIQTIAASTALQAALLKEGITSIASLQAALQRKDLSIATSVSAALLKEFSVVANVAAALLKGLSVAASLQAYLQGEAGSGSIVAFVQAALAKAITLSTALAGTLRKEQILRMEIKGYMVAKDSWSPWTAVTSLEASWETEQPLPQWLN